MEHQPSTMRNRFKEYARLCRIEYLGFSCVTMLGALSVTGRGLAVDRACFLFCINLLFILWSFVHNDYCDVEYDRQSPELQARPLVKGSVSKTGALGIIVISLLFILFMTILLGVNRPAGASLALAITLAAIYNRYGKKLPGSDLLFAVSAAFLCLFGALAATEKGSGIASLGWLAWVMISIQLVDHLFFNIEGALKDVAIDFQSGALTTPIRLGVRVADHGSVSIDKKFKSLCYILKGVTIAIVFSPFLVFHFSWHGLQMILLVVLAVRSVVATRKLLNIQQFDRKTIGHLSVSQENAAKLMIPVMLFGHIGYLWVSFFIFVPSLWFLASNYVVNNGFIEPPRTY